MRGGKRLAVLATITISTSALMGTAALADDQIPEDALIASYDTEVTTIVKPSLGWGVVSVPVYVKTGEQQSDPLDFSFTAAPEPEE